MSLPHFDPPQIRRHLLQTPAARFAQKLTNHARRRLSSDSSVTVMATTVNVGHFVAARLGSGILNEVLSDPEVTRVEANCIVKMNTVQEQEPIPGSSADGSHVFHASDNWGLDRIDQREPVGRTAQYRYNEDGRGVIVYVLDSGVKISHNDFGGRTQSIFEPAPVATPRLGRRWHCLTQGRSSGPGLMGSTLNT